METAEHGQGGLLRLQPQPTMAEQRESLPIFTLKNELVAAVSDNQFLVVIGETGSGKTAMTRYMAEAGFTSRGIIGCAAAAGGGDVVAKRVARSLAAGWGRRWVLIRFEDYPSQETVIKYMADGCCASARSTPTSHGLAHHADEAHERTISADVLFGLLKGLLAKRKDLKLICTSATLDAEKYSTYFFECPIFAIPRTPVSAVRQGARVRLPRRADHGDADPPHRTPATSSSSPARRRSAPRAADAWIKARIAGPPAAATAHRHHPPPPPHRLHPPPPSAPPRAHQSSPSTRRCPPVQTRIFEPPPPRKIVVATNIAEASLTIDGIYYVVGPGFVKQKVKRKVDALTVVPISASARQRAAAPGGRARHATDCTEAAYKNEIFPLRCPRSSAPIWGTPC